MARSAKRNHVVERGSLLEVRTELTTNREATDVLNSDRMADWQKIRCLSRSFAWGQVECDLILLQRLLDWLREEHGKAHHQALYMGLSEVADLLRQYVRKNDDNEGEWSHADYPSQLVKSLGLEVSTTTFWRLRRDGSIRARAAGGKRIQVYLADVRKYVGQ
jgi:hypothetical protein